MYVYIESERGLYTVGHYEPGGRGMGAGRWISESDHNNRDEAAARVSYLNGGPHPSLMKRIAQAEAVLKDGEAPTKEKRTSADIIKEQVKHTKKSLKLWEKYHKSIVPLKDKEYRIARNAFMHGRGHLPSQ